MNARAALLALLLISLPLRSGAQERTLNGFALEPATVPVEDIRSGGPPRDGIPALNEPDTLPASAAPWGDDEPVVGVHVGGASRAYPLGILVWHELVNDELGGTPLLVSYCPLCGTALVFDRRLEGRAHRFGVSGLLYQSDLLMFDRESDSLWSQITARAVTGPRRGERLTLVRSRVEPWAAWRARHPDTTVLSPKTGHERRYGDSPYGDYALDERLIFPVEYDRRYHAKMPTLGLRLADGTARAYPASELVGAGGVASESFAGHRVRVSYDPDTQVFDVEAPAAVEVIEGFWFAWFAFHPKTSVFSSGTGAP
jgi:hypothetical protein